MTNESEHTIAVFDPTALVVNKLQWLLDKSHIVSAATPTILFEHIRRYEPALCILSLDEKSLAHEAINWIRQVKQLKQHIKIILFVPPQCRQHVYAALNQGVYDFCEEPVDGSTIKHIVERACSLYHLEYEYRNLVRGSTQPLPGVITADAKMEQVCAMAKKVASTNAGVLIIGESGTGKELIANAIHQYSERASDKFVAINCAAIPENLLESELFGYEKGAFTGACQRHIGKLERAHTGTLFLDEISDMPLNLQPKLLRVLQERKIERIGGKGEIPIDVRVICAANQDLPSLITEKRFREDLYYRVSEIELVLPPLRERGADVVMIAHALLNKFCHELNQPLKVFGHDALLLLESYLWPGNVRELENKLKTAIIMAESSVISAQALNLEQSKITLPLNLRQARDGAEQKAIQRALSYTNNNISQAAKLLGITRPTLYHMMDKYRLRSEQTMVVDAD